MGDIMTAENKKDFLLNAVFIAAVLGIALFIAKFMFVYLLPFIIGVVIAFAVQSPALWLSERIHLKKQAFAVLLTVIICIAVLSLAVIGIWALGNKISAIITNMPKIITDFQKSLDSIKNSITDNMKISGARQKNTFEKIYSSASSSLISNVMSFVSSAAAGLIKNLPAILISSIVTVVASCYIAKDFDRLKNFLIGIISKDKVSKIGDIKKVTFNNTGKFLKGYGLISLITFFELCIALYVLKINNPIFTAFIIAFVDLLPVLGVGTVLLPWSAIKFISGNFYLGFGLLVSYSIIVIIRNFLEPKIIGDQMGINPIFTLVSMFLGLKIAGIAGMLLCPLALTVFIDYYREKSY